jgi:GNAT superfamily N-acetyltransferase
MVLVRRATVRDLDTLVDFSVALCLETDGRELDVRDVRAGVAALLDSPECLALVAEDAAGRVVGEIMIGAREWYDWSNGQFWWVTSVYVHPEARLRGVARALYSKVRELARAGVPRVVGIRGCVRQDNLTAHAALGRLGRRFSGQLVFEERFGETP